jgi:hypothetical protein
MEYVEIIAVCCEIQTKHTNALCGQNAVFLNGENSGIPPPSPSGLKRGTGAACLLARIVSSNPAGGMEVCLLWVLCVVRYRSLRWADYSSRRVPPSLVCLNVSVKPRQGGGPDTLGVFAPLRGGGHPSTSLCSRKEHFKITNVLYKIFRK